MTKKLPESDSDGTGPFGKRVGRENARVGCPLIRWDDVRDAFRRIAVARNPCPPPNPKYDPNL